MIKKITLLSTLISTLMYADIEQKGFFVGIDGSLLKTSVNYAKKGSGITTSNYASSESLAALSAKIGYQYYFTRIYARVNSKNTYIDKAKNRYTMKNQVIELNVDYLPVFYINKNKSWNLRGVMGVGVGANKSVLSSYDARLDSIGQNLQKILDKQTQYNMEYGLQLGLLSEFDFGLSAELGYRFRTGLLVEFSDADSANEATWKLNSQELYLGLNYLF